MNDKIGYNQHYKGTTKPYPGDERFESTLRPFSKGGRVSRGYARGLAVSMLLSAAKPGHTILDAGCGVGDLSIYLAKKGLNVIGVDISEEACAVAQRRANEENVRCRFLAESLEKTSLEESSVDYIIGLSSLHHFIKYNAPPEFTRVLKPGGQGFFADSFGENRLYRLFQDEEKMARLGDVNLNRKMIYQYFDGFEVDIIPTDWFVMLDRVYQKFLPEKFVRRISRWHAFLDRTIPMPLFLAGVVVTRIRME